MITYLLTPVYSRDNATETRTTLTSYIKNDVNTKEQIGNLDFRRHIESLFISTTVVRKIGNSRKIVAKKISNDFR